MKRLSTLLIAVAVGATAYSTLARAAGVQVPTASPPPSATATPPSSAASPVAPYGNPITPEQAIAVAERVEAEKVRRGIDTAAIAVVDPAGRLVYFERQDNATFANEDMAVRKGRAAARLRRPTSVDAARLKAGDLILLLVPGAFPADGGEPIVVNGRLIGAVGVAGGAEDGRVAQLGAKSLN